MSLFSKAKKYRKPSHSIDEKVKLLNKELEKTGIISEITNSSTGLYCVQGDRPEENEDIAAVRAAAEAAGVANFTYGGSTSPDGTTRNNLFQGWGNWGPEDTPTMWWKEGNDWKWIAWIPHSFWTQYPGGTHVGAGWGVHVSVYVGARGVPRDGVPAGIEAKLKDENGDYITPEKFSAPPGPPPVIFQGGLGDPDYYPGDPQKNKSKEEEEAEEKAKNDLGVGDEGLEAIKNQAEQDSEEGSGITESEKAVMEGLEEAAKQSGNSTKSFIEMALDFAEDIGDFAKDRFEDATSALPYSVQIALSELTNTPLEYNDRNIAEADQKSVVENLLTGERQEGSPNYDFDFWEKVNITETKQNYADENIYRDENGDIQTNIDENGEHIVPPNAAKFGTSNYERSSNPLGNAGEFSINIEINPTTGEAYFHYEDHAYNNHQSDNPAEVPDWAKPFAKFVEGVNDMLYHDRTMGASGELGVNNLTGQEGEEIPPNWGSMENYPANEDAEIRGDVSKSFSMPLEEAIELNPGLANNSQVQEWLDSRQQNESYIAEGWASPKHTDVDKDEKKRWFNPKEIHPDYPREAPPEMVDGWHPDLKREKQPCLLRQLMTKVTMKKNKLEMKEYIKIKEVDLIKNYRMKGKEIKKFMNTINSINSYLTRNPSALIHAQMRYPKSDPHLAALNYKMDIQLAAADEYIDKQFPENQRLYNKLIKATQRSIKLTDPKTFKDKKGKMTSYKKLLRIDYVLNEYDPEDKEVKNRKIKSNKKSAGRFFRKPKKKTKDDILKDKMAILDKEMKKTMPDY